MKRADAIEIIAAHKGQGVSVATMRSVLHWYEAGAANERHIDCLGCIAKYLSKSPANRLSHFAVHRCQTAKECILPSKRLIDKLVNHHQISGADSLPK